MAIDYRISGDELTPGGVDVEQAVMFAKEIQDKLDIIHVSAGNLYHPVSLSYMIQSSYLPMATNVRFAKRFREELHIPVTTVGSFNLDLAEKAVSDGSADVVAMIRQFIADPDCVNKARDGRGDEIRPCIRCCICTGSDPHGCPTPLRCSVNPPSGRNPRFDEIPPLKEAKKVVIVGGGAGGMEAARRLSERGANVILFEKEDRLGGSLILAGANPIKGDVARYADWSVQMTERLENVEIRLSSEATPEAVKAENPDAVIVAVGSDQIVPEIPGISGDNVMLAVDVDMGTKKPGKKVVLVGAGLTGTETAVTLARQGHEVTLIDMLSIDEIDSRGNSSRSCTSMLRRMAEEAGVETITGLRLTEVRDDGIFARDESGKNVFLPCDSVVLSMGVRARSQLAGSFDGTAKTVIKIGDCVRRGGNILTAVLDGFYAAMNI